MPIAPDQPRLWLGVTAVLASGLELGICMSLLKWLLGRDTGSAAQYLERGASAMTLGRYETAIAEFTKALAIDPNSTAAYVNRSFAYSQLGKCGKAIADCNTVIERDPQNSGAYGNRGVAYARKGDFAAAIRDYDRALQLNPELLPAYLGRGGAHGASGCHDKAIAAFTKALEFNPMLVEAHYNRGVAYYSTSQYEKAIADFTETLRLDPHHSRAEHLREYALRAFHFSRLEERFALVETKDQEAPIPMTEVAELIRKCVDSARCANRYRTIMVVSDIYSRDFEPYNYEVIRWNLEFMSPGALRIQQHTRIENFPNGAGDEWITVRTHQYQLLGQGAAKADRPKAGEIEAFLKLDNYVRLLESSQLSNGVMYRDSANDYLLWVCPLHPDSKLGCWRIVELRSQIARSLWHLFGRARRPELTEGTELDLFLVPVVSDLVPPRSIAKDPDLLLRAHTCRCRFVVWIASMDVHIAKVRIEVDGELENGETVSLRLEQVFGDWNGDIVVEQPDNLMPGPTRQIGRNNVLRRAQ